jgi:ribosomal protein S12 methylthiotransferase accessory factor
MESFLSASRYGQYAPMRARTRDEVLQEIERPCGRFKVPKSVEQHLAGKIYERLRVLNPLGDGEIFIGNGAPLQWLRLLEYLYEKNVIEKPHLLQPILPNDRPKFPRFRLKLHQSARPTDGHIAHYQGFGAMLSAEEAISKAIGEALERYFLSLYARGDLKRASQEELRAAGNDTLDIRELNGFLPWQKELLPLLCSDTKSPLLWVEGQHFTSRARAWLPAQTVYWNYRTHDEPVVAQTTTSGCAGHFTRDEAVLSGLLELIQRDAFLIFWLNKLSPPIIDTSAFKDPELSALQEYADRYRLQLIFLNTTSDIAVPTVTCVVKDERSPEAPIYSLGSATGFDVPKLLVHSALEALLVNEYAASSSPYAIPEDYKPFQDRKLNRAARLSAWKGPVMAERLAFFISGEKRNAAELAAPSALTDTRSQLEYVLAEFAKKGPGYDAYVYDAHDTVLTEVGYHVVRTIVPQLIPLYLQENTATLDAPRLRTVPKILGYEAATELNPWPHLFP